MSDRELPAVVRLPVPVGLDPDALTDCGTWERGEARAGVLLKLVAFQADRDRKLLACPVWETGPLAGQTRIGGYTVRGWVIVQGHMNAPLWLLTEVEQTYLAARASEAARAA